MIMLESIARISQGVGGTLEEKGGVHTMRAVVAEQKGFLSKKRLEYIAKFRIDEPGQQITCSEMLKETRSGLVSGGLDEPSGFAGNTIEQQAAALAKKYTFAFDPGGIRNQIEAAAAAAGYRCAYQLKV